MFPVALDKFANLTAIELSSFDSKVRMAGRVLAVKAELLNFSSKLMPTQNLSLHWARGSGN
jgi:hypothetical protein